MMHSDIVVPVVVTQHIPALFKFGHLYFGYLTNGCPRRGLGPVGGSPQTPLSALLAAGTDSGNRTRPEVSQLLGSNLSQVLEGTKASLDSLSRDLREASSGIGAGRPLASVRGPPLASMDAQNQKPPQLTSVPGTKGGISIGLDNRSRASFAGKENSSSDGHRDRLRTRLESHDPPTKPSHGACIQQVGVELEQWIVCWRLVFLLLVCAELKASAIFPALQEEMGREAAALQAPGSSEKRHLRLRQMYAELKHLS